MALRTGLPFVSEKPDHVRAFARTGRKRVTFSLPCNQESIACLQAKCTAGGTVTYCCSDFGHGTASTSRADHDI